MLDNAAVVQSGIETDTNIAYYEALTSATIEVTVLSMGRLV